MKKSTFKVLFLIRRTQVNKDGKCAIMIKVTVDGEYERINSTLTIEPELWDASASKAIGLAAACVSMLTLESTMLTTFSDGGVTLTERRIMLGCTGAAICLFIVAMAVYMIVQSSKKLKELK